MVVFLIAVGYLLGTLPSAIWVANANGIDISAFGSGNPGASNVTRALGWRKGAWVYVLDATKGAAATGLSLALDGRPLAYAAGTMAIVGHMFPVFRGFKGGKGVATGSGVLAVLFPLLALYSVIAWWIVSRITDKAAIGSIGVVASIPILLALLRTPAWEFLATALLCVLILLKHTKNVRRIMRSEEHSVGSDTAETS